jgi:chloramphenicol-sensitive protein RarD
MSPALLAVIAYAWWGLVPVYWKLLQAFPAEELILYRVLLSTLTLMPLFWWGKRRRHFLGLLFSHQAPLLLLSAALIGFNWYLYVWAITHNHVVESSLGYFINPLMNVALGTLVLKETMRAKQKAACAFAAAGAALLAWTTGTLPWIALLLATSFALYGLARKLLQAPTLAASFFELLFLSLPAGAALSWLYGQGLGHAPAATSGEWILLGVCGCVSLVPLLCFTEAAKRMPLSVLGFFQFLSPTLQFLLGVFVYKEPFGLHQWMSFGLIWLGLTIFLADLARGRKRQDLLAEPSPEAK